MLHPFMPFVTEELWQHLKSKEAGESIMVAPFPVADLTSYDVQSERIMEALIETVHNIRNTRAQYKVEMNKWIDSRIYAGELTSALSSYVNVIKGLARTDPVIFLDKKPEQKDDNTLVLVLKEVEIYIPMSSMVDMAAEKLRLEKEAAQADGEIGRLETRLADANFLAKAPPAVVEKERQKLTDLKDRFARLQDQIR